MTVAVSTSPPLPLAPNSNRVSDLTLWSSAMTRQLFVYLSALARHTNASIQTSDDAGLSLTDAEQAALVQLMSLSSDQLATLSALYGMTETEANDLIAIADANHGNTVAYEPALGYTPVNKAGDTMSGNLDMDGNSIKNYITYWRMYSSATYIKNTSGTVILDSTAYNPGSAYNAGAGTFTCPYDGLYLLNVNGNTDGTNGLAVTLKQNSLNRARHQLDSGSYRHFSMVFAGPASAGDVFSLVLDAGVAIRFDAGDTYDSWQIALLERL